jgi:hypothetical protein
MKSKLEYKQNYFLDIHYKLFNHVNAEQRQQYSDIGGFLTPGDMNDKQPFRVEIKDKIYRSPEIL